MKILNKKLSLKEFDKYVEDKDFGKIPPTFLVLHHTWRPTVDSWRGGESIKALKSYYENKGWSAGPHLFIAEDGIWLFTDMYEVGIHAGAGNGNLKTGYSIGIEVVGNYDSKVWSGETKKKTVGAIKSLMKKLNLKKEDIKFHRDYSSKSCPGHAITKDWVYNQLETSMKKANQEFYDKKGWKTLEDWVEGAREYHDERDKAQEEVDILYKRYRKLIEDQGKINEAHDLEMTRQKNTLTKDYNTKLDELKNQDFTWQEILNIILKKLK